jgi:photosystem II stability/assembly factor-like uncharacterized protein
MNNFVQMFKLVNKIPLMDHHMTENELNLDAEIQDAVYALAASPDFIPAEQGVCFAARPTGLYRSDDGGRTWQDAYASLELEADLTTAAVAVSSTYESDRAVFAGVGGGILRSFDAGQSWHIATLPSPPPFVLSMVISPNFERDGVLLAGTMEDGVFRSADRGSSWNAWNFGLLDLNVLCLAISPDFAIDETLFVGTDSGIFRSTNGGRAWREVDFSLDLAPVLSLAISPDFGSDSTLFAGTEDHGLFQSTDGGQRWQNLGGDRLAAGPVNSILLSPGFPTKPDLLILSGDVLLVSRDGGQSWSAWPSNLAAEEIITAVLAPQGLEAGALLLVGLADGRVVEA